MSDTFRCEYVRCGKAACRSCPHGPYWYAYWRAGGRVRKRYIGKQDPRPVEQKAELPHPHDAIFNKREATRGLAMEIMQCSGTLTPTKLRHAFNILTMAHHPDRGGDAVVMARINAAYSYLCSLNGW